MQKIFRCGECKRGMRIVGSTGLGKEVERTAQLPVLQGKKLVSWPRGDKFRIQRVGTR